MMNANFICFLSLMALGIPLSTAQKQVVRLYNATNCSGAPYTDYSDTAVFDTPSNGAVRSFHVLGLWKVSPNPDGTVLYSGNKAGGCIDNKTPLNGSFLLKMRGDSAMKNSTSISLFTSEDFLGNESTISTSMPGTNFSMKSYYFTGPSSTWVLYTGANYTENATCLTPSKNIKKRGWGHTFQKNRSINIRSIQRLTSCPTRNGGSSILSQFNTIWSTGLFALVSLNLFNRRSL